MHILKPLLKLITPFNALLPRHLLIWLSLVCTLSATIQPAQATDLADNPLFSGNVSGNVALALSVEFPTALGSAYYESYNIDKEYVGYFDANKCYKYYLSNTTDGNYFQPVAAASSHACDLVSSGRWSGNFLNWALTQTIDPFRFALSGGYRSIDKTDLTVLEKAWASGQGGTVAVPKLEDRDVIKKSTPFYPLDLLKIKINGLGNKFYITSTGNIDAAAADTQADGAINTFPSADQVYQMSARVQVCKANLLEANCSLYPSGHYKPIGLIQKNALRLNFAAFGYLFDPVDNADNLTMDGGVLRARMGPVGPYSAVSGSTYTTNENSEWDANTGVFYDNPASADSLASGVNNSGVINYLNKFGLSNKNYKRFDPVSELYYTVTRYFRNKGNVPEYYAAADADATKKDDFPVIKEWDDPIKYSCQANFIIGVGDTNSHADANLPGSSIISNKEPTKLPIKVEEDFGLLSDTANNFMDVKTSTNRIGAMEELGNLGEINTPWCCNKNTFFMAGIAYDVHTRDIRTDFSGDQTITTYWLDVLEGNTDKKNFGGVNGMRNQYWLTAKYGGFTLPTGFKPYDGAATVLSTSSWDENGDDDPDNYFRANNPALMIEGLNKTFDNILYKLEASSSAFAVASKNIVNGDYVFSSSYNTKTWSGNVVGSTQSYDASGVVTTTKLWDAADKLDAQSDGSGWNIARFIATSNCGAKDATSGMQNCKNKGIPFRYANISSSQQDSLNKVGTTIVDGNELLNFLRGDRSNAGILGSKTFRDRSKILGDIVNAKVRAVGAPNAPYSESTNPGYAAFKSTYASRPTVAYAAANDGLLHAFNGADGKELFAYVPHALFAGPNNTPWDDGLAALAKKSYIHHAYVDSTPVVVDVNFGGGSSDWHSLLIGGLGKGGKSYYAIDVTNPSALSNENALASAVKWEFTHKDLGYSYGKPLVVKAGGKWLVILTSGYNNVDGHGYFFILDAATGALIQKVGPVGSGIGTPSDEVGLANVTAFVADGRDFTADAAYAGDLLGNVWRLDLTSAASNTFPAPVQIAKLVSPNGGNQPITVSPVVEVDQSTSKRYVFVGTGRLLADSDVKSTQLQSFYAIVDGTASEFYTTATLPSGSFPTTRSNMVDNTETVTSGISASDAAAKPMGYYIDLGLGATGTAYRINIDIASAAGIIAFAANSTSDNICNTDASYRAYAVTYGRGRSVLLTSSNASSTGGTVAKFIEETGAGLATSVTVYRKEKSEGVNVKISESTGDNEDFNTESAAQKYQQLNWRVLPTND